MGDRNESDPCANPFDGMAQEIPRPSVSLNAADGTTTVFHTDSWAVGIHHEERDALPGDPHFVHYLRNTVATGRRVVMITFKMMEDPNP